MDLKGNLLFVSTSNSVEAYKKCTITFDKDSPEIEILTEDGKNFVFVNASLIFSKTEAPVPPADRRLKHADLYYYTNGFNHVEKNCEIIHIGKNYVRVITNDEKEKYFFNFSFKIQMI